ncbi:hypothetical protein TRFO_31938 [Tritrichomonas foetus]|uniref:UBA domain-containing protein n=1 Tax=Tritrichomonas foetus TaxID=1144522 RepID=A0A1J4JVH7_9EUKA|nr:hypothetical protein TRFO_31938 [Tritrichomonas foetus]|eukprot:OHT01269.1 hypothetical protein TRFO_31938 [Tritrichomonas foetus]
MLCWPTILEGFCMAFCLWAFRHIERLLGRKSFAIYLLYNVLTFLPTFLLILQIRGFKSHFSFLFFIPFSLFVFMLWRLPATHYSGPLTDKFIVCLAVFIVVVLRFPFSIMTLLSASIGYYCWTFDIFKLRRILTNHAPLSIQMPPFASESNSRRSSAGNASNDDQNENSPLIDRRINFNQNFDIENNVNPNMNHINSSLNSFSPTNTNANSFPSNVDNEKLTLITSMGFSEEYAIRALHECGGDVNEAIDYLLGQS